MILFHTQVYTALILGDEVKQSERDKKGLESCISGLGIQKMVMRFTEIRNILEEKNDHILLVWGIFILKA